jgi:hypothetical protein
MGRSTLPLARAQYARQAPLHRPALGRRLPYQAGGVVAEDLVGHAAQELESVGLTAD